MNHETSDSVLKYGSNLPYDQQYGYQYGDSHSGNRITNPKHVLKDRSFFRKPHLQLGTLNHYPVDIEIGTGLDDHHRLRDSQQFHGMVWTIPVRNRNRPLITRAAMNCSSDIHISVNGVGVGNQIPLIWRRYSELPIVCDVEYALQGLKPQRDEYSELLAYFYSKRVVENPLRQVAIPSGLSYELFFLFTFSDSNFAYIIVPFDNPIWTHNHTVFYHAVDHLALALEFDIDYRLQIRSWSDEPFSETRRNFLLNIHSWDTVSLMSV
jgi:hypothetical protein